MATSTRDVELIVRAKDEATKAITGVADALKILSGMQAEVGQTAEKADGILGQLGSAFRDLGKQVQGLGALGTAATQIDRAAAAVGRLEATTNTAGENASKLANRYDELAEAGSRLAAQLGQSRTALDAQRGSTAQAEAEQRKLTLEIERASAAYNQTLATIRKAKEPNDQLRQSYREQRDTLISLIEQQGRSAKDLNEQRSALGQSVQQYGLLEKQVKANSNAQQSLYKDVEASNNAFIQSATTLEKARTELGSIKEVGAGASAVLGGVALSQEAISEASKLAAQNLDRVKDALERQKAAGGSVGATAPTSGASAARASLVAGKDAVTAAELAYRQAQVTVASLNREIRASEAPTLAQRTALLLAKTAAADAKVEFDAQTAALAKLRNETRTYIALEAEARESRNKSTAAAREATAALRGLPPVTPQAREDIASLKELAAAFFRIPQAAGEAADGVGRFGNSSRESLNIVQRLRSEVLGLAASYIGLYGAISQIQGAVKSVATLESAQARLSVIFEGNKAAAARETQYIFGQAERLGIPFNDLANEYTKVAIAAKEMGFSNENARKIFYSLAEAGRVAGLSAHEMSGVFLGLRESIDRGTINARNFNLEIGAHIPGAMQAMAQAAGVSIQKFTELQRASGGVAANETTLVRFAQNIEHLFSGALPESLGTVNAELGRFATFVQEAQIAVGDAGFTAALKKTLDEMGALFKSDSVRTFFADIGHAFRVLTNVIPLVVQNFSTLVQIVQVLIGIKVAGFVLDLAKAGGTLSVSFARASVDVARLEAALTGMNVARLSGLWNAFQVQIRGTGAALAAMGVEGVVAAGGVAIAGAAMATLRGIMIGLTAVARTMWLAIGGFPGAVITGLTFVLTSLLGGWISGVDKATSALEAHDRIMQRIRDDYAKAGEGADALKKKVTDVTTIQVAAENENLRRQLDALKGSVQAPGDAFGKDTKGTVEALRKIIELFKAGKMSAADFKAEVNRIGEADPKLNRDVALNLEAIADKAIPMETALKRGEAAIRLFHGAASATDKALLNLSSGADAVNGALSTKQIDLYREALEKLDELAPDGKKDAEKQKKLDAAKVHAKEALQIISIGLSDIDVEKALLGTLKLNDPAKAKLVLGAVEDYRRVVKSIDDKAKQDLANEIPGGNLGGLVSRIKQLEGTSPARPGSDIAGIGQFKASTFLESFNTAFAGSHLVGLSDVAKLALRFDEKIVDKVIEQRIKEIIGTLAANGKRTTPGNIDLLYTLGTSGGLKVLNANSGASAAGLLPDAAAANKNIFYKDGRARTVGQLEDLFDARTGGRPSLNGSKLDADGRSIQEVFNQAVAEFVRALDDDAKARAKSERDTFVEGKVTELRNRADREGVQFTPKQEAAVRTSANADFTSKADAQSLVQNAELKKQVDELTRGTRELSREEFIANEVTAKKIDLSAKDGEANKLLLGSIYDLQQQQRAYNDVLAKGQQLATLQGELRAAFKAGDGAEVARLQAEITKIRAELNVALPLAQAFAKALADPKSSAELERVNATLRKTKTTLTDAKEINGLLATGITGAFGKSMDALGKFISGTGKLKDVLVGVKDAFLGFAADFLKHIAEMILQQTILNLLAKSPIGDLISQAVNATAGTAAAVDAGVSSVTIDAAVAGAGAFAATAAIPVIGPALAPAAGAAAEATVLSTFLPQVLAGIHHTGGIAGMSGGIQRSVSAEAFSGAMRLHSGGIAGIGPNEVPTILEKGEEVLSAGDARHRNNGGGMGGGSGPTSLKIVNLFDHGEVMSQALNTDVGQQAFVNFVRKNARTLNQALKV